MEESSTTSATPPSDDATSMSQEVRTCSSSDLMGSSASKSPRIDWKPSWKDRYLVDFNRESQEMICMVCHLRMRCVRSDTVNKHFSRVHKDLRLYSLAERRKIQLSYMKYCSAVQSSRRNLKKYLDPAKLASLAPYKLAFIIAQHKKPFSDCNMCVEFASAADPLSKVFSNMASSRRTVVRRMNDIFLYMKDELKDEIQKAMFLGILADESIDTAVSEQLILYMRYVDISKEAIITRFAGIQKVEGHPNAENLFKVADGILSDLGVTKEFIVCSTVDGASAMFSAKKSVVNQQKQLYNAKLLRRHCLNHREVLAGKAGHKMIPKFVEETIDDVLKLFKYSAVHQSQFKSQLQSDGLVEIYEKGTKLIHYHKIRWTSYNECVKKITDLFDSLSSYLQKMSEDMANSALVRRKCTDLHQRFTDTKFILYMLFLKDTLPVLAVANKSCQERGIFIHESYGQIMAVVKTVAEPIVRDKTTVDLLSDDNLLPLSEVNYGDDGFFKVPGEDFNKYWKEMEENALFTSSEKQAILKNCHSLLLETTRNLLVRFPELDFVIQNLRFVDPRRRERICCNLEEVLDRFDDNFLDRASVLQEYALFRNDQTLDALLEVDARDGPVTPCTFWCQLYKIGQYKELAKLAVLVMTLTPDTVECERGFSCMNYIKNELRSNLTATNLNAAIAIGSETRTVDEFPFEKVALKYRSND